MTTVAIKDGKIAADNLATQAGHVFTSKCNKIYVLEDAKRPCLIAHAGRMDIINLIIESAMQDDLANFKPPKKMGVDMVVIYLDTGKAYFTDEIMNGLWEIDELKEPDGFFAFGSGRAYAYGAMEANAFAEYAIHAASKYDIYTGNNIQVVDYAELVKKHKTRSASCK